MLQAISSNALCLFHKLQSLSENILDIPEDLAQQCICAMQVAFSSVSTALRLFASDLADGSFHIHHGVIEKKAGAPLNDPAAFQLRNHFAITTSVSSRA